MDNRFKFRVWNKKHNCYHTSDNWFVDRDGQLWFKGAIFETGSDEDFTIEQCTGLKDTNGKLIYEGDVISRNKGRWKEIRFYQGGFGWWTEYDCFVSFSGHNHLEEVLQTHEIIGNIHEMEVER